MLKSLFFIAIAANIILCVSSTGSKGQCGGRPNESWQQCPNRCAPQNCSQVGNPIACPLPSDSSKCPSKPGCACNNGYVKNDKGICIPIKNCPSCGGDENAVSGCGACVPTCSNCNSTTPRPCPRICYPNSCDCKKGYVLDENTKKCVEPKNCSPICGQNEEYSPCANGGCHTGRTCDDLEKLNGNEICLNVKKCEQGCLCKKGYLRNKKGVCIPENDCPSRKCSRPNEHYEICPDSCRPSKCSQLGYPISCPETTDNSKCSTKPGCVCDEGYVRNDNGTCIPTQNCPSCGGDEYARSGCGNCPTTCSNYKIKDQIFCIQICYANACDCIKDYVLDENTKKCVKIKDCTPQCGQNETYSECINGGCHTGRTCDESMKLNGSTICIKPQKCKKGCLCKDGYVRDSNGVCIPLNDCPYKKCNKENNEHYEICPDDCTPRKCSQLGYPQPCTSLNSGGNGTCSTQPACVCDDGYVRNDKGKCIPSKQCPSCGGDKNAVTGCGNCRKLCRNVGSKEPQICPLFCNLNGCDCREGYVYDENIKKCVLPKDCSQVCGQNEQYTSCIESCAESKCEQKSNAVSVRSGHCTSGCMCRDGFSRNRNGVCVPSNECSLNNKCSKKYQYWDPCPPNCVSETCASIGQVLDCPPQAAVCRPRCRCADGYRIDSQGNCVLESQCNQCGKNETYDYCFNPCPPRECGVNIAAISCLRIEPEDCKGGCRCQDGYLRNKNGDCVAEGDCPPDNPCTKANEVYDVCPSKCPPGVCGIDDTLIDCAPSPLPGDPKCPPPTCKCASGYYRDNKGECVKWEDCPKCPKHEVYDPCGNPCPGELCSTDERVIRCKAPPQIGDEDCVVGCRCKDGYKRNDKGKCVPKDQCPPKCPVNEIYDICPPVCPPQDCSVDETLILCAPNPKPGSKDCKAACRCKDGYKRNSDGVCIPKKECPPKCNGADEVWNPCPNPKDPNTCDSIIAGNYYSNDKTTVRKCKGKCTCKPGYYRNKIGECVAKENCLRCKGPHEYYSCGGACDNVCATLSQQNQTNCPIVNIKCNEKCYCEEGYARDSQNICVPIDTCRCCQGEHEWYDTCPTGCPPNDSCNTYRKTYSCPLQTVPPKCGKPICKCEDNYLRLNGTCVPQEQCPCNGDPNAQPGCGCSKTCSDYYADKPPTCTKICKVDGCDCKEGYVRDTTTGKCVLPKDCPRPTCPKNEIYDLCPASCPPETCPNGRVYKCAAPPKPGSLDCKARCRCKDGYYRDSTGKCIPKDQCPSEQCRGPNESYDPCPDPCALTKCEDLYCTRACATANAGAKQCKGECRCSPGYYRNKIGECIAKENCLKCQGPHEYYSCGGACDNVCATLSQQNQTNCPIINIKCNEKCYCEKQYARDSNGVCIPISSCPPSCNGDPNAEPGCCGQTCANYDPKKTPICNKHCTKDACQCKKGYVLDEVSGKCVLPKNCLSTSCKVNEEYSTCTQAICRHQECTKKGKPVACPGILAGSCLKGCVCKKEYLRLKNGTCVHESLCPTSDPQPVQNRTSDEAALQTLSQGVNIFCFKFFQQALKAKSGQNVIMSPWSVQIPLAQLAIAAESETLKQLLASLNLANKDQIRQAFPLLLDTLKGSDGVTFDKAVRLYINDEFPLLEEYIAISEKVFNATAENVNCRDSTGTANKINKDVESVTNNRIKNLISPDVINDLTRLILVNAIYFKGTWKKQFNVNNTKEQNFYTYDKRTVPVQMMNIETTLEYTKDNTLNAQIVRLTYTDEEYSLVVILPNEKYGFDKTASSLNAETVKAALGNLYKTKVNLYLPKMEINADFELIPILQNLGIVDIFDAAKSNLKGILKIFEPLYVTAAKQKAFFQANEQGTEAAAATAVVASTFSLPIAQPQVIQVKADHPFVFAITAKNNVIFIGNYAY